jgi:hypothetical protein
MGQQKRRGLMPPTARRFHLKVRLRQKSVTTPNQAGLFSPPGAVLRRIGAIADEKREPDPKEE